MRRSSLACLLVAGCSFRAGAAPGGGDAGGVAIDAVAAMPNYFVDYVAGDDHNDGRSITTAWQHAPGDTAATAVAASTQLDPSDVVLFKGGVAYHGAIAIAASGSPSGPIIYTGADNGQWGTGLAIVDEQETRVTAFAVTNQAYVQIDSFVIEGLDKTAPVAIAVVGGQHVEISDNQISDVYYASNPNGASTTTWAPGIGIGVSIEDSTSANVHDNHIRDVGYAGILYRADDGHSSDSGTIARNDVTNMNIGIRLELDDMPGSTIDNVSIVGNTIHDFDNYVPALNWHRDGLDVSSTQVGNGTIQNVQIADNYFTAVGATFAGSNGWVYITGDCTGFVVHHNIFNAAPAYFALRFDATPFVVAGNHVIASNVFANATTMGAGMHIDHTTGTRIANNIFYDDNEGYEIATTAMTGLSADFDLFERLDGVAYLAALNAGPASSPGSSPTVEFATFADLQTAGLEAHGIEVDPMFSTAQDAINADPTGFEPLPASMAIDHGTSAGFSSDFLGTHPARRRARYRCVRGEVEWPHGELRVPGAVPTGHHDDTPYRLLTADYVSTFEGGGRRSSGRARSAHAARPRPRCATSRTCCGPATSRSCAILDDPEASPNDRFVALELLKNAYIAAGGILPVVPGHRHRDREGQEGRARAHRRRRRSRIAARHLRDLRERQPALLADGAARHVRGEEHRHQPAGADRDRSGRRRRVQVPVHGEGRRLGQQEPAVPGDEGAAQPRRARGVPRREAAHARHRRVPAVPPRARDRRHVAPSRR